MRRFIIKNTPYSQAGLTSGRRPVVKLIVESLSQHDEKHVVPDPLSVIRVEKIKKKKKKIYTYTKIDDG
jgi:hypothetical protein